MELTFQHRKSLTCLLDRSYAYIDSYCTHNGYGDTVGNPGKGFKQGHQLQFYSNICLIKSDGDYAKPVCTGKSTRW